MYYQPKFSLVNGEMIGSEALIRWNHPEHGFISPAVFIPIAEKSKLILKLGDLYLKGFALIYLNGKSKVKDSSSFSKFI